MSIPNTHPLSLQATALLAEVGLPLDYELAWIEEGDLCVDAPDTAAGRMLGDPRWVPDDIAEGVPEGQEPVASPLWSFRRRLK